MKIQQCFQLKVAFTKSLKWFSKTRSALLSKPFLSPNLRSFPRSHLRALCDYATNFGILFPTEYTPQPLSKRVQLLPLALQPRSKFGSTPDSVHLIRHGRNSLQSPRKLTLADLSRLEVRYPAEFFTDHIWKDSLTLNSLPFPPNCVSSLQMESDFCVIVSSLTRPIWAFYSAWNRFEGGFSDLNRHYLALKIAATSRFKMAATSRWSGSTNHLFS